MKLQSLLSALLLPALALSSPLEKRLTSTLQQVTAFTNSPAGAKMFIYKPTTYVAGNPIVVAIHYCSGTASAYFNGVQAWPTAADSKGFLIIYPQSPYSGTCWDVSSTATLTHNGGGSSNDIANMITYAQSTYGASTSKVYVTGSSSGAMMTQVLAATYPNLFAAGSAYSGVPAGCFYTGTVAGWNSTCSSGASTATADKWASIAKAMYPGYSGARPKMQMLHGTADTTISYNNLAESVKQWTGVLGVTQTPTSTEANTPQSGYTSVTYGSGVVQAVSAQGVGHDLAVNVAYSMKWFGL